MKPWSIFDFLVGSHRIQRVPDTEKNGRRHTSVIVVAKAGEKVQFHNLNPKEVRFEYYRSSGAGGQHRNKTENSCRAWHIPTGMVAQSEDHKSKERNRLASLKRLESKVLGQIEAAAHNSSNTAKKQAFDRSDGFWNWCGWRDEVKMPSGKKASMKKVLKGRFNLLV